MMRIGKTAWFLAGCVALAACATSSPYPPPPPLRSEVVPNPPVSATPLVWRPGYWSWVGGGYSWSPGEYVPAGGHSNMWMPGYWARDPNGDWAWQPAHWM